MKNKKILTIILSAGMILTNSINVFAAPKQMPDGTMFDAQFYAQTYPDVANALGTDENVLYNHYVQFGKAEGRKATADSTAQAAPAQATQTNTNRNAILYNSKFGIFEYYAGPKDANSSKEETKFVEGGGFDEVRYATDYPDVAAKVGTSHNALWNHFKTTGFYEGRSAHYKYTDLDPNYSNYYSYTELMCILPTICNENMTDMQKAIAVKDWLRSYASYDYGSAYDSDFWSKRSANCMGYTEMYKKAMNLLGIEQQFQWANNHSWNIVLIDGKWIKVDVTWNIVE